MIYLKSARAVEPKTIAQIASEWDAIAATRHKQISSGLDVSFDGVLVPMVTSVVDRVHPRSILDVGCGSGALTEILSQHCSRVVGIDPSARSIELAQSAADSKSIYIASSVEDFARECNELFDFIVANMTIMDTPDLIEFLDGCSKVLSGGGWLYASITHPWFWPYYWGYASENWFRYDREIYIESEFRISAQSTGLITTHIHRPLEAYYDALTQAGFVIDQLAEPMPSPSVEAHYPIPWQYPRFLVILAQRIH